MFKDYYVILDIPANTTKAEIKPAYKRQAIKWHPDKNHGADTTQKMQEINEAYLILNDDEARMQYDREYPLFSTFQKEQESKKKEKTNYEQRSSKKNRQRAKEEYSNFQFDNEQLKQWMENARKQAIRNVHDMVIEFRESSVLGFGTFFKTGVMAIVVSLIYFIIAQILKSI